MRWSTSQFASPTLKTGAKLLLPMCLSCSPQHSGRADNCCVHARFLPCSFCNPLPFLPFLQVVPAPGWQLLFDEAARRLAAGRGCIQHLLVLLPVPIVYPKIPVSESLLASLQGGMRNSKALRDALAKISGDSGAVNVFGEPDILDDLQVRCCVELRGYCCVVLRGYCYVILRGCVCGCYCYVILRGGDCGCYCYVYYMVVTVAVTVCVALP